MHLLSIPPGGRAKAHLHQNHETAIYVLSGEVGMWFGEDLAEHLSVQTGDFLYIPAGMPHLPYNKSQNRRAGPHRPQRAGERGALARAGRGASGLDRRMLPECNLPRA